MDRILSSWHKKGLRTLSQIEAGDKPPQAAQPRKSEPDAAREDMARMEKYRQQLRREMEGT